MDLKHMIYEIEEEKIAFVKLNRPNNMNALGMPVLKEFIEVLQEIRNNPSIRIIVITSAIKGMFSAGADVNELSKLTREEAELLSTEAKRLFKELRDIPLPVIAAIDGLCLTAGLELTVSCDLIISSDISQFGQIEPQYGLTTAAGATQRLTQLIGPLKAREMLFTARIIKAPEALEIGLVNRVVSSSDFDNEVLKFCHEIIKNSPRSIRDVKLLINLATYESEESYLKETKTWGAGYKIEGGFIDEVRKRFGSMIKDE